MKSEDQAHGTDLQIREFAQELGRFSNRVEAFDIAITPELRRLGDTYRDKTYDEFVAAYQHSRKLLMKFIAEARQTVPELNRSADGLIDISKTKR